MSAYYPRRRLEPGQVKVFLNYLIGWFAKPIDCECLMYVRRLPTRLISVAGVLRDERCRRSSTDSRLTTHTHYFSCPKFVKYCNARSRLVD